MPKYLQRLLVLFGLTLFSVFTVNAIAPNSGPIAKPQFTEPPIELRKLEAQTEAVQADLDLILREAKLEGVIAFSRTPSKLNVATIQCTKQKINVAVEGGEAWSQAFYMSLQRMGFLFPHPRRQISPTFAKAREQCGKTFSWNPAVKYSGFHLHTLHPSEWVHGFLMGKTELAAQTIRWLARNQQNTFDLSLLRMSDEEIFKNLHEPLKLAKSLGIHSGVAIGFAFHQQRAYKLISLAATFVDGASVNQVEQNLTKLLKNLDLSFVNLELGTSEFTPTNYERSLKWMNKAAEVARKYNAVTFIKIHTSSNQKDKAYGNYNLLPSHAHQDVGVLPHTVFLYGVADDSAPMYGNPNFHHIRDFMLEEKGRRNTWFYPETSYFIALDIDVPLLLTDYLLTRARDTRFLAENGIQGQLNFSTGQEVGYWLNDWTYTLLNNRDYNFDPLIGVKLLGEDTKSWQKIVDFQNEYFIKKHGISQITFVDFGTELLPGLHEILKRNMLSDLNADVRMLKTELDLLTQTAEAIPKDVVVKDPELAALWEVTKLRVQHSLENRKALTSLATKKLHLDQAAKYREEAQKHINYVMQNHNRYPEAKLFDIQRNPTAYPFGYAYTVKDLHYWKREEEQVRESRYRFAFSFMSLYSISDVIRGWVL